jgi:hypothetical protein
MVDRDGRFWKEAASFVKARENATAFESKHAAEAAWMRTHNKLGGWPRATRSSDDTNVLPDDSPRPRQGVRHLVRRRG